MFLLVHIYLCSPIFLQITYHTTSPSSFMFVFSKVLHRRQFERITQVSLKFHLLRLIHFFHFETHISINLFIPQIPVDCNTYNADYDGDKMNCHFPQNERSSTIYEKVKTAIQLQQKFYLVYLSREKQRPPMLLLEMNQKSIW